MDTGRPNYLEAIVARLNKNYVGLLPCTIEEVNQLETSLQIKLPEAYREYLLTMGKYSGKINEGTDCFYDDLACIKAMSFGISEFLKATILRSMAFTKVKMIPNFWLRSFLHLRITF
jgi:hypothetical protein